LNRHKRLFERTIDRDVAVYEALISVYRKVRKMKNRVRGKLVIDRALEASFRVQWELAKGIAEAKQDIQKLSALSIGSIANDLRVATALLKGAWSGAYCTAEINVVYVSNARQKVRLVRLLRKTPKV